MLTTGMLDKSLVCRAEKQRFDQMPVIEQDGTFRGLIAVEHARTLVDSERPLLPTDPALRLREVEEKPLLFDLLAALSEERAVIYLDPENGPDWFALVTISDLSRHPFRAHLYPPLAELETELAQLIEDRFGADTTWLDGLTDYAQIGIVGRWDFSRRKGVDTSLVTGCLMSDLLEIVGKRKEMIVGLGFPSKGQFDAFAKPIKELRNDVMHAVKPLVWKTQHVETMRTTLLTAHAVTEQLKALNAASTQSTPVA